MAAFAPGPDSDVIHFRRVGDPRAIVIHHSLTADREGDDIVLRFRFGFKTVFGIGAVMFQPIGYVLLQRLIS